jgi:phospholipid/cholesterol/gamma-HCH transport system substrate-binding protein
MKFKMRYADQIVGLFIIIALLSLIAVIFMLGRAQRWFSRNYSYVTYVESASGLSKNMPVNFRGFSIGNVKSFDLTDDNRVKVIFTIQDKYKNRVRRGSLTEILVSPIGLGNQFIIYAGIGAEELEEFDLVPMRNSQEGKDYIARGITNIPPHDDSIAVLMAKATIVMDDLHNTLNDVQLGNDATELGRTIIYIQHITADLSATLSSPNGILKVLSGEGDGINSLEAALVSLAGTMDHIEKATAYIPREMPQIVNLLSEARTTLQAAEDVLIALRNNPLLRNGIPEHAEIDSSGTNPRNITF